VLGAVVRPCQSFIRFWWGDRGLSSFLLLLFVSLFLGPLLDSPLVRIASSLFFSLVLIAGVANAARRPLPRLVAGAMGAIAIVLRWAEMLTTGPAVALAARVAGLAFLVLLTAAMLVRVFGERGEVTVHRVNGAVAVYVLFGITWSVLYQILALAVPGAFSVPAGAAADPATMQENLTYFSFITLTTLGYGDITAVHPTARMFVILEALVGQLYPATLLARLVSLEVGSRR
jgi:hypothetical protein